MIALGLLVLVSLALVPGVVKRVPAGQVHSLYRLGKPRRLLPSGMHVVLPGFDRIGHRIDLAGQVLRFNEPVPGHAEVHGTVYWQVLEPERADAVFDQAAQLIRRGTVDALSGEPEAEHADRRDLAGRLKLTLNDALRERGMMVTRVELDFA
jgi:regulator of protease activity HflC (stomatin/prohibitin superfamily)